MRRACSPFEAWGAWPRSRFAARSANCLKVAGTAELGREEKTAPFGKALVLTAATNLSRGSGGGFFTKLMITD